MAQLAREELFAHDEIACVHVMNRAVRRCFLMGNDPVSGKNFDHRKRWMERKLEQLAAYFGIDLLGSAILSLAMPVVWTPPASQKRFSAPQKQPRPKSASSMPSGKGGSRAAREESPVSVPKGEALAAWRA